MKVFTVFDSKAGAYLNPFFLNSTGEAIRAFGDTANDPNTGIGKHPEDYSLFEIGEYDNKTGRITHLETHTPLGNGIEYIAQHPEPVLTTHELKKVENQ